MIPRHLPPLAALCVAVLLVGACTSNSNEDGDATPTTAPPSTENAGDEPVNLLDEETAVDQYVALQHAIIQLAPIDPGDIDVEGAGDGIVVEDSPAAAFLTDRLSTMAQTGSGPSGEVVDAEVLELREEVSGEQASAELCVLQETEPVDLATGEAAEGVPETREPRYTQVEVAYRQAGGSWLIDNLPDLERDGTPPDCIPPAIEQTVRDNWEAHERAVADWIDASFAVEARAPLEPLVTEARWQEIEATEPQEPTGRVRGDIAYDLELLHATGTEVFGEWCLDGNRDPDAMTLRNGELVDNDTRSLVRGRWRLEDGEWLRAANDEDSGDTQILAGTVDAPEGHRCL